LKLLDLLLQKRKDFMSILGGEPLADENIKDVISIMREAKGVDIWLYTGYTYDKCLSDPQRKQAVQLATYVIDGQYVDELKDLTLKYRGSSNQTIRRTNETNGS
jgi:anaerobic ribonucleoside-triphosphate reductase activating protein